MAGAHCACNTDDSATGMLAIFVHSNIG